MRFLLFLLLATLAFTDVYGRRKGRKNKEEEPESLVPNEAKLYRELMKKYGRLNPDQAIIPVFNTSETMRVNFGLALIALLNYDDDIDIATFHSWERYLWKDNLISWDPEDFGGIDQIRLPISKIWKPDLVLYNGFDPEPKIQDALAVVSYDGTVLYIPVVYRKIMCSESNASTFSCMFKFGSWTYDGFRLDVDFYDGLEDVDLADYVHSNNYDLIEHSGKKNVKYYPCCAEPYPDLAFSLTYKKMNTSWWGKKK